MRTLIVSKQKENCPVNLDLVAMITTGRDWISFNHVNDEIETWEYPDEKSKDNEYYRIIELFGTRL